MRNNESMNGEYRIIKTFTKGENAKQSKLRTN